jgi:hypothetical protein
LDRKKAVDNINAVAAMITARVVPLSSFTIRAMSSTEKLPTTAGKKRKAKTVFPNKNTEILETSAMKGGTETYPQSRCSPKA